MLDDEMYYNIMAQANNPYGDGTAFDATTVTLFSDVMKGVGPNPKGDGK